jgi:hypothetical protein
VGRNVGNMKEKVKAAEEFEVIRNYRLVNQSV